MIITMTCDDFDDAIEKLQMANDDDELLEEIEGTEEGDTVYTNWGTIEV